MHGARPLRSTKRLQLQNLTSALPKWYSVVRNTAGPALVSIYDEIGFFGVSAADFMAEVSQIPGDIELHLNSPGGDVFDGIAIYNQLKAAQARGTVSVIVDGLAASAASFIAMAASPGALEMCPNARMMIHDGFGMAIGNAADMREMADQLDDASDNIASMYAERTGKPQAFWRAKMQTETWYSPEQAVADGLVDGIHGQARKPENAWDMTVFQNAQGQKGTHGDHQRFDPDGDGDDDSSAEGDTDHDYVLPDGSPGPKARLRNVQKPHGDVPYADPGYLDADGEQVSKSGKEGVARYPVDAEHVEAAWSYINQGKNAGQYTPEQLASIKSKIKAAMKQHGHEVSDDDASNLSEQQVYAMFTSQLGAGKE